VSVQKNKSVYRFDETVSNLNVGIAERICDLFTTGLFFYFFDYLHKNFSFFDLKATPLNWLLLFLFTDLLYYWYHRYGHRVNILWAAHVVHHQSEDYNYSVAVRVTTFQALFRGLFWSFLPIIGFPAEMITLILIFHGVYPFFSHTQLIGKLGWLEYIVVTPSHHRVHHSSNPEYLDKNYGDVLIIWDKLFGTFQEEKEKPVYGLTKPLNSHSFLWQHFHFFLEMFMAFRGSKGLKNKWKILFGKPDDLNPDHRTWLEEKVLNRKNATFNGNQLLYKIILFQIVLVLSLLFFIILFVHHLNGLQLSLASLFVLLSVINNGAMLEQKSRVFYLDYSRVIVVVAFVLTLSK
jgi:sterol desaturase/sphingolipid hydroxylase (fatty acid hydroxylase superfamily)